MEALIFKGKQATKQICFIGLIREVCPGSTANAIITQVTKSCHRTAKKMKTTSMTKSP